MWREKLIYFLANILGAKSMFFFSSLDEGNDWFKAWRCYTNGELMKAVILAEGMQHKYGYTLAVANLKIILAAEKNARLRK